VNLTVKNAELLARINALSAHIAAHENNHDGFKFDRGDRLADLVPLYESEAAALEDAWNAAAEAVPAHRQPTISTLRGELWVSRAIPYAERDLGTFCWSVYREVSSLNAIDRARVYREAQELGVYTVTEIRRIIAAMQDDPAEVETVTDFTRYPWPEAVRIELRRHFGGRLKPELVDEFVTQYERIERDYARVQEQVASGRLTEVA
jgi:hypothetical protein